MKTNIKFFFTFIFALIVTATTALGRELGPLPELNMLTSQGAFRSYAVQQVSNIRGSVYSASLLPTHGNTKIAVVVRERPVRIDRLRELVSANELSPAVANPLDYISFYLEYASAEGDTLFQGSASTMFFQETNGVYYLGEKLGIELFLNYQVPVSIPGIFSARLILVDESGRTVQEVYLKVNRRGIVYFPSYYTGDRVAGYLVIRRRGEGERIIDIRKGIEVPITQDGTRLASHIRDFYEATASPGSPDVLVKAESYNGFGESPTLQLRVENSGGDSPVEVRIQAFTTEDEKASHACWRFLGAEKTLFVQENCRAADVAQGELNPIITITLLPGLYDVIFYWRMFRPYPAIGPTPVIESTVPVGDGGGGGGEAVNAGGAGGGIMEGAPQAKRRSPYRQR